MDTGRGEERVRCMKRVTWKLTLPYVKQTATGICCMAQETQTGALYQPVGVGWGGRTERSSRGRGYMYRKTSISALLTMPKPLTVWITIN